MYDILELNKKLLVELREIAKELNIRRVDAYKKQDLIYKILDEQAIVESEKKSPEKKSQSKTTKNNNSKRTKSSTKSEKKNKTSSSEEKKDDVLINKSIKSHPDVILPKENVFTKDDKRS